jgi:hypothetical protein
MNTLVDKLRSLANNKALDIGTAWNVLDEAADNLEVSERLCRIYFEIAVECIGEDEVRRLRDIRIDNVEVTGR